MLGVPWYVWLFCAGWWLSGFLVAVGVCSGRVLRLELCIRVRVR